MKTSEQVDKLFSAFVSAQAEMPSVPKDAVNPHFKSKYATLQAVSEVAKPVLKKHGLAVAQTFSENTEGITIETTLVHSSGQWLSGALFLKPTKQDPQGYGSAITYGRRYALAAILGIVADDDDDANQASAPAELPWLNKDKYLAVAEYIAKGGAWADVEKKYRVSKESRKAVDEEAVRMAMEATDRSKNASQILAQADAMDDGLPFKELAYK